MVQLDLLPDLARDRTADWSSRCEGLMTAKKPKRAKQLGITTADYNRLLLAQGGHCAICPATPKTRRLHVDHDHRSGAVRGLLCHKCNRNLPTWVTLEWLAAAMRYLGRHELLIAAEDAEVSG